MALRSKSGIKRHKQSLVREARNRKLRTELRHNIRALRAAIAESDTASASAQLPATVRKLDRAVSKGILHRNSASRRISRLSHQVHQLAAN